MGEQANWRFCQKCHGMFFAGYGGGRCPGGDKHSAQGANFVLPYDLPSGPTAQQGWRFCKNCCAMFFEGYGGGRCPAGGSHVAEGAHFVLPHDVESTETAQKGWSYCNNCHSMFFTGYGGGQCPAGGNHAALGFNFVLPHRTGGFIPASNPPGRAGVDTKDLKQMFSRFIANAEYYGMPVGFLRAVGSKYKLDICAEKELERFTPFFGKLELSRSTYDHLLNMNADVPYGEGPAIALAYHESTHAYLTMKKDDPVFKRIIEEGQRYYTDAPLANGKAGTDPERLFQEAAASYVEARAAGWWIAFKELSVWAVTLASTENMDIQKSSRIKARVSKIPSEYNDEMKRLDFGYEGDSPQQPTTKPISASIKSFLDSHS